MNADERRYWVYHIRLLSAVLIASLLIVLTASSATSYLQGRVNRFYCTYQGKQLYGKIKVVETLPDIKVKVVYSSPDLRVKLISTQPERCGEWQAVEFLPDFKVKFVENFFDIEIQFVESLPGVP